MATFSATHPLEAIRIKGHPTSRGWFPITKSILSVVPAGTNLEEWLKSLVAGRAQRNSGSRKAKQAASNIKFV
jgi:hypothetical protein